MVCNSQKNSPYHTKVVQTNLNDRLARNHTNRHRRRPAPCSAALRPCSRLSTRLSRVTSCHQINRAPSAPTDVGGPLPPEWICGSEWTHQPAGGCIIRARASPHGAAAPAIRSAPGKYDLHPIHHHRLPHQSASRPYTGRCLAQQTAAVCLTSQGSAPSPLTLLPCVENMHRLKSDYYDAITCS